MAMVPVTEMEAAMGMATARGMKAIPRKKNPLHRWVVKPALLRLPAKALRVFSLFSNI